MTDRQRLAEILTVLGGRPLHEGADRWVGLGVDIWNTQMAATITGSHGGMVRFLEGLRLTGRATCPECEGRGGFDVNDDSLPCARCQGQGTVPDPLVPLSAVERAATEVLTLAIARSMRLERASDCGPVVQTILARLASKEVQP